MTHKLSIFLFLFSLTVNTAIGQDSQSQENDESLNTAFISLLKLDTSYPKEFIAMSEQLSERFRDTKDESVNVLTITVLSFENYLLNNSLNSKYNPQLIVDTRNAFPGLDIKSIRERCREYMRPALKR